MEEFFFPAPCGSQLSTKDQTCPPCCGKALTTGPTRKSSSGGIDLRNRNNLSIVIEKAEYRGTAAAAAAAAAKLLQSCPTLQPHRQQSTRHPRPWDSPGKNTGVGCHFLLQCMKGKSEREVAQSCLTLSNPMDCSLPGSSIHGIFQARVLEWGAIAFSVLGVQGDLMSKMDIISH